MLRMRSIFFSPWRLPQLKNKKMRTTLTFLFFAGLFLATLCGAQTLTTIAGTGVAGASDGKMDQPFGLGIGPDKALYYCEVGNHRISRLDLKTKKSTVVAEGLGEPYEIAFDRAGDLFFCDRTKHSVSRIDRKTKAVTRVAGTGAEGFAGDGGPAIQAQFRQPHSIAFTPDQHLLICDILNFRIRSLDLKSGTISTWAGTGKRGPAPDGSPLTGTPLDGPRALAIDKEGNYFLALREGNAIYRLDVKSGRMYLFAGTGEKGFSGDGEDAKKAKLAGPKGVALAPDGSLYIADTENHAIRRVDHNGIISTVAGTGERGDGPDGDPHKAKLARPHGVFVDAKGVVYIGDSENHRIRILR
jgi:streptogramin lyase